MPTKLKDDLWWNKVLRDRSMLDKCNPPKGAMLLDDDNDIIRVSYLGHVPTSFAWARRGAKVAACLALRKWWQWFEEGGGHPPELGLASLFNLVLGEVD